jgi:hypothetical protein
MVINNNIRIRIKVCFDPDCSEHRSRLSTALISDLPDQASLCDRSDRFTLNMARTQSECRRLTGEGGVIMTSPIESTTFF